MSLDRGARVFEHPSFRERYDVADRIGYGSFAQVYRAVQRTTGQAVHLGMAVAHERLGKVHDAGTQGARAREILVSSLVSPASNPMRILARRRDALARMASC